MQTVSPAQVPGILPAGASTAGGVCVIDQAAHASMADDGENPRQRLRQLTRLTHSLTRINHLDQALPLITRSAARLIGSNCALLFLVNHDGRLHLRSHTGLTREPPPISFGVDDQLVAQIERLLGGPAYLAALTAHEQQVGVLAVARPEGGHDEDVWLLSVIADHAAIAIADAMQVEGDQEALESQIAQTLADSDRRQLLMSTMAHDLRSPLLTIRMGTQLVEQSLPPDDLNNRDLLHHVRVAALHLEVMAQNLLEMGRMTTGTLRLHPRQQPLGPIIEQSIALVEPPGAQSRINVDIDRSVSVFVDAERLRQILANLLSNALKYAPADSTVTIQAHTHHRRHPPMVSISVTDRGPGIAADQQESVFRPYYRIDDAGFTKAGAGLGLSIARELARRMGGDVTLTSEPGKGSIFTVDVAAEDVEIPA